MTTPQHSFTDAHGDAWPVRISVATCRRVRDLLGVDITDPETLYADDSYTSDVCQFCDVLYIVCKPIADERTITDLEFGERLAGPAFCQAADAYFEALCDFFRPEIGAAIRTATAAAKTVFLDAERTIARAATDPKALAELRQLTLGNLSPL